MVQDLQVANEEIQIEENLSIMKDELKPKNICCPEGIWSFGAARMLAYKEHGEHKDKQLAVELSRRLIEVLLTNPEIEVFTIDSFSGSQQPLNKGFLRSGRAAIHFTLGIIPYVGDVRYDERKDGKFIFINRTHFQNFLMGRSILETIVSNQVNPLDIAYVPPYIEFMLKAVSECKLNANQRINKDLIKEWIDKNWPNELDGKSDRLIEAMVTLLRRPEDKKGGNTSWEK